MKQYRLKKDLPYREAGETLTWDNTHNLYCYDIVLPNDDLNSWYTKEYVESSPEWFEEVKPKHKLLELLENEYENFVFSENKYGFSMAIDTVRNYLGENEPLFCEGVKDGNKVTINDEISLADKEIESIFDEAKRYNSLIEQACTIQPNAGDSYYVELGKLLDKHLREEK